MKSLEAEWSGYYDKVYQDGLWSPEDLIETRNAFYAGAMAFYSLMREASALRRTYEAVKALEAELRDYTNHMNDHLEAGE